MDTTQTNTAQMNQIGLLAAQDAMALAQGATKARGVNLDTAFYALFPECVRRRLGF